MYVSHNLHCSIPIHIGTESLMYHVPYSQLLTHANLMFENECLGELAYEGTACAILMAGLFLSFVVDYAGQRLSRWHAAKKSASVEPGSSAPVTRSSELVNVALLEAGIIFHSLRTYLSTRFALTAVLILLTWALAAHSHRSHSYSCRRLVLCDSNGGDHLPPDVRGHRARLSHRGTWPG